MASLGKILSWVMDVGVFLLVIIFSAAALQAPYAWGWWFLVVVGLVFILLTNPFLVQKFGIDQRVKARKLIAGLLIIPAIGAVIVAVNQIDDHDFFVRHGETMAEYNLSVERYNAISDADDHRGSNAANRQTYKELCDKKVGLACFKFALLLAKEGKLQAGDGPERRLVPDGFRYDRHRWAHDAGQGGHGIGLLQCRRSRGQDW